MTHIKEGLERRRRKDTILLGPGSGFGSGRHPTTRCCLRLMETCFEKHRPFRVLDAGCGSGVLSIAAALLGAKEVSGVDLKEEVADTAGRNVRLNHVQDVVDILCGDAREVHGDFDLILANLDPDNAVQVGKVLEGRLVSGGHFILSGLAGFETDRALKEFIERRGLDLVKHAEEQGWSTLLLRKPRSESDSRTNRY